MDKSFLSSILVGEKLRLRKGAYPHSRTREWLFEGVENEETVLLSHEIDGYVWGAKMDDIDWNGT